MPKQPGLFDVVDLGCFIGGGESYHAKNAHSEYNRTGTVRKATRLRYTHEGHNLGFLKLASQALTVKQPIPKSQIMTFESIATSENGSSLLLTLMN